MDFLFDKDIFLLTNNPVALGSRDHTGGFAHVESGGSGIDNFTDLTEFAEDLKAYFPGKKTLLDFGTATGTVPLTGRKAGLLSVGIEGSSGFPAKNQGAWKEMPDIVRTCDAGKPWRIVDKAGRNVIFDFIISWGTVEHIPVQDFQTCMENILAHIDENSIIMLNIDLGYNETDGFHMLWETFDWKGQRAPAMIFLEEALSKYFIIDKELEKINWRYSRPTKAEVDAVRDQGWTAKEGRSYWWLRKR
jgi:cyclopropane fatty-acyl-phospholipid synthase-like methyltransferase